MSDAVIKFIKVDYCVSELKLTNLAYAYAAHMVGYMRVQYIQL